MGQRYPAPLHRKKILSYRRSKGGFSEPPGLLGTPVAFTDLFAQVLEHDAPVHIKRTRASKCCDGMGATTGWGNKILKLPGQGADLLEKCGLDGLPDRVTLASYSASRSFRTAAIWRSSNSVKRRPRQRSAARMSAPNISLRTGFSPKPFGIIFSRRRSSTKRRSSGFVVRVARRCVTGNRRCAMQASKSWSKQENRGWQRRGVIGANATGELTCNRP